MARTIRTAVAAIAAQNVRSQAVRALSEAGIELLSMENNGHDALDALAAHRPDLLLADIQLPAMEGSALALRVLGGFELPVRPAVALLRYPEYAIADEPALVRAGVLIMEKPVSIPAFRTGIDYLRSGNPCFSAGETQRADALLSALGVPAHRGRDCLRAAILLCAADERCRFDLGNRLYPQVGGICKLEPAQAERAMRHAIGLAWQSDKFDNQYRIFADTVDAGRGQPTCGEMISRLADILRLEG